MTPGESERNGSTGALRPEDEGSSVEFLALTPDEVQTLAHASATLNVGSTFFGRIRRDALESPLTLLRRYLDDGPLQEIDWRDRAARLFGRLLRLQRGEVLP